MKQGFARVISHQEIYPNNYLTWFAGPELVRGATAGQFVMVRCAEDSYDPLLPRAFSYHRLRQVNGEIQFALLYTNIGRGTHWLATRQPGDEVFMFGPLGHGFAVDRRSRNLLLVGGGVGIAPLVWLADEAVAAGNNVTLLIGARTANQVFPPHLLPAEVEVAVATDDGTAGAKGFVSDLVPYRLAWADQVFACGPNAMFRSLAEIVRKAGYRKPVQALLEERMACGTGICYSCAVETRKGVRLVCKNGPRFELRDVF